jgi:hypothetical protein
MLQQKFVVEIRFIPKPQFIDIRGQVAAAMASEKFSEWLVSKDRVDVSGNDGLVFASYTNLGFITLKRENIEMCIERLDEALKLFGDLPPIRWGVRIYTISQSNKKFVTLLKDYEDNLIKFNPEHFSKINGKLEDIGISYVFKSDKNKYLISTGPMEKQQAAQFFPKENLPERGIFIDLDIYRETDDFYKDDFRRARILTFIRDSFSKGQEIVDQLLEILNGKTK